MNLKGLITAKPTSEQRQFSGTITLYEDGVQTRFDYTISGLNVFNPTRADKPTIEVRQDGRIVLHSKTGWKDAFAFAFFWKKSTPEVAVLETILLDAVGKGIEAILEMVAQTAQIVVGPDAVSTPLEEEEKESIMGLMSALEVEASFEVNPRLARLWSKRRRP